MFQQTEVDRGRKDDSVRKYCRLSRQAAETELVLWRKTVANKNRLLRRVTITADRGPLDSTDDTAEFAEMLAKNQQWDRTF